MKGKTRQENYWLFEGYEYRHCIQQNPDAARNCRKFTKMKSNRARRLEGRREIERQLREMSDDN